MIFIFGVDHYMQNYDLTSTVKEWEDVERLIKERFYNEIQKMIREKQIGLIAEECKEGTLAAEEDCKYLEIDMPMKLRRAVGIADDYEKRDEERLHGYQLREKHMYQKLAEAITLNDRVLVICGREHLTKLRDLLIQTNYPVCTRDMTSEDWFDPPWEKAKRGELFY